MMDESFVQKIEELSVQAHDRYTDLIGDTHFHVNSQRAEAIKFPMPKTLDLFSLSQVVNYIKDVMSVDPQQLIVNVESHDCVTVLTSKIQQTDRHVHAKADFSDMFKTYEDGRYLSQEDFIIQILSRFASSPSRDELLKTVSSIKSGQSVENDDDGFSQKVEVKAGITLVKEQSLKNLWDLYPHKTFPEVNQPSVSYILRVKKGTDTPQLALFEADGGLWKVRATATVREWLIQRLKLALESESEKVTVL